MSIRLSLAVMTQLMLRDDSTTPHDIDPADTRVTPVDAYSKIPDAVIPEGSGDGDPVTPGADNPVCDGDPVTPVAYALMISDADAPMIPSADAPALSLIHI